MLISVGLGQGKKHIDGKQTVENVQLGLDIMLRLWLLLSRGEWYLQLCVHYANLPPGRSPSCCPVCLITTAHQLWKHIPPFNTFVCNYLCHFSETELQTFTLASCCVWTAVQRWERNQTLNFSPKSSHFPFPTHLILSSFILTNKRSTLNVCQAWLWDNVQLATFSFSFLSLMLQPATFPPHDSWLSTPCLSAVIRNIYKHFWFMTQSNNMSCHSELPVVLNNSIRWKLRGVESSNEDWAECITPWWWCLISISTPAEIKYVICPNIWHYSGFYTLMPQSGTTSIFYRQTLCSPLELLEFKAAMCLTQNAVLRRRVHSEGVWTVLCCR